MDKHYVSLAVMYLIRSSACRPRGYLEPTLTVRPAAHTRPPRKCLPKPVPTSPLPAHYYPRAHHSHPPAPPQSPNQAPSYASPPNPRASLAHLHKSTQLHTPAASPPSQTKKEERTYHIPNPPLHILQQLLRPSLDTRMVIRIANHLPRRVRRGRTARVADQRGAVREPRAQRRAVRRLERRAEGQHVEGRGGAGARGCPVERGCEGDYLGFEGGEGGGWVRREGGGGHCLGCCGWGLVWGVGAVKGGFGGGGLRVRGVAGRGRGEEGVQPC